VRLTERGQSTVEFALVLPLVVLLLLVLLQAGLLLRDQLLVSSAAREAAREAVVSPDRGRIERAAGRAAPGLKLGVEVDRGPRRGDPVTVRVTGAPTAIPLVGGVVKGVSLEASATMRVEQAG
jgi:hypothetical protein